MKSRFNPVFLSSSLFAGLILLTTLLTGCDFTLPWEPTLPGPATEVPLTPPPTETPVPTVIPTAIPTVGVSENLCDNPYWPIREGAYWIYNKELYTAIGVPQYKLTINNIVYNPDETTFILSEERVDGDGSHFDVIYHCTRDGIFDDRGNYILPYNVQFQHGASYEANGQGVVARMQQFNVPAGNFDAVLLCWDDSSYGRCIAYSLGVGPVQGYFDINIDYTYLLVSYYVPPLTTDEARVRYILADIQLGGVDGYYREHVDAEEVAEALRRWDAGITVTNIDQFERKLVGDTWQVVYAGTETLIDGKDVLLSTDPQP